jgi:hypothetical protein
MHGAPRYSFLLRLCGSKFFNVLINFSLWKVSAVALPFSCSGLTFLPGLPGLVL